MDAIFLSVITYVAILIYICNVVGNFLVIMVLQVRNKKLCESPNTFLLLSLAHSDLWFSVFSFVDVIILTNQACFAYFEIFLNALASIYIYAALAVERYFAILKPFVHMRKATKSKLGRLLILIYIVAIVLSAPGYFFGAGRIHLSRCRRNTSTNASTATASVWIQNTAGIVYSIVLFVFGLVVPSSAIIVCYSRVIYHVWFRTNENKATNAGLVKSRRKLTKLFILLTVVFILTWTPTFVGFMVTQLGKHHEKILTFELFSKFLGLVGSTANPVIYSFRCPQFRREVVKILPCYRCKQKIRPTIAGITGRGNSFSLTKMETIRGKTVKRRSPYER